MTIIPHKNNKLRNLAFRILAKMLRGKLMAFQVSIDLSEENLKLMKEADDTLIEDELMRKLLDMMKFEGYLKVQTENRYDVNKVIGKRRYIRCHLIKPLK